MTPEKPSAPHIALRVAIALVAGSTLQFLAPPANLHWLHWVVFLPMFWALRADTPRANRWLGYIYGVIGVAWLFRWLVDTIVIFSNIPTFLAIGILLLFAGVFGSPYTVLWASVHPLRKRLGDWWIVAVPAVLVLIEYLSMFLLLFPYTQGVSQFQFPYTWQLASVTGVWGLSFLVMFVNCAVAEGIYRQREGRPLPWVGPCVAISTLSVTVIWGAYRYERVEEQLRAAPTVRIAQLQSSVDMQYRLANSANSAFKDWLRATTNIPAGSADIVVWPEGACPYDLSGGRAVDILSDLARKGGYEMVIGGGTREREVDPEMGESRVVMFNSVYFFDDDGEVTGRYDKMVPLPFGEYFPFGDQVPWLRDMIEGIGSFRAGDEAYVARLDQVAIAAPICYEAILPRVARSFEGANLFVNVTNDAWFGDTAAPHQHAMLAVARTTELGIPMFRSAYSGVSMVAEPHGAIHYETEPFHEVNRIVTVRLADIETPYRRFGDWFVAACFIGLLVGWFVLGPWRQRQRPG